MRSRDYRMGLDVLGAGSSPSPSPSPSPIPQPLGRALLIRVINQGELASKQGGALGTAASAILPGLVENQIYSKMMGEMKKGFDEKGVVADISLVDADGFKRSLDFGWGSALVGALLGGGAMLGLHFLSKGRNK